MTATGLLSDRHARECIAAGYRGPWLAYFTDGWINMATTAVYGSSPGWIVGLSRYPRNVPQVERTEILEHEFGLLGFAPPTGFWLPMETAPRDGREIFIKREFARYQAKWIADRWAEIGGNGRFRESVLISWQPIVEVRL